MTCSQIIDRRRRTNKQRGSYSHLLAILLCGLPLTSCAIPRDVIYYDIKGTTLRELRVDIAANSPAGSFGNTRAVQTIETEMVSSSAGCRLTDVNFKQHIEISMPRWVNKHEARSCLRKNFRKTWKEVLVHEHRHREINRELDAKIETEMNKLGTFTSCAELNLEVERRFEALRAQIKLKQDYFHATGPVLTLQSCPH